MQSCLLAPWTPVKPQSGPLTDQCWGLFPLLFLRGLPIRVNHLFGVYFTKHMLFVSSFFELSPEKRIFGIVLKNVLLWLRNHHIITVILHKFFPAVTATCHPCLSCPSAIPDGHIEIEKWHRHDFTVGKPGCKSWVSHHSLCDSRPFSLGLFPSVCIMKTIVFCLRSSCRNMTQDWNNVWHVAAR